MAYTPQQGFWNSMAGVGEQLPWDTSQRGYWSAGTGFDYSGRPDPAATPTFDEQGRHVGWTTQNGTPGAFSTWDIMPDGSLGQGSGTQTPSRNSMTNFMGMAVPAAMAAGLGYGALSGAFGGAGGLFGSGTPAAGAAEGMWPGLATAGGGGVPGGYAGAIGAGAAPSALSGGTLAGGLGGSLGGFGNFAGAIESLPSGAGPWDISDVAGAGGMPAGSAGSSGGGISDWLGRVSGPASQIGSSLNNGSLLGGGLGGLLGYLDAKNQPDSLTVKQEIDPRLAQYAYGADGTGGIAGAANTLMQQQLAGPNPLVQAGQQISGMANTLPNWNQLVDQSKTQWDSNPWVKDQQKAITDVTTRNLLENVMPNIGSNANMAGGYGGSRQGIAQGLAMSRMNQDLAPALTGLASNAWESSQNRALNSAQSAGSYGLNNQAQQAGLLGTGATLQTQGAWNPIQNATNVMGSLPGNTSRTQPLFSNPWAGAIGGASVGSQVGGGINWGDLFKGIGGLFK